MSLEREAHSSVYIGETEDLKRRSYHYRHPGPRQKTSLRINELLRNELAQGTSIIISTVTNARIEIDGKRVVPYLERKPFRLLFENAALVAIAQAGIQEIHNL